MRKKTQNIILAVLVFFQAFAAEQMMARQKANAACTASSTVSVPPASPEPIMPLTKAEATAPPRVLSPQSIPPLGIGTIAVTSPATAAAAITTSPGLVSPTTPLSTSLPPSPITASPKMMSPLGSYEKMNNNQLVPLPRNGRDLSSSGKKCASTSPMPTSPNKLILDKFDRIKLEKSKMDHYHHHNNLKIDSHVKQELQHHNHHLVAPVSGHHHNGDRINIDHKVRIILPCVFVRGAVLESHDLFVLWNNTQIWSNPLNPESILLRSVLQCGTLCALATEIDIQLEATWCVCFGRKV